MNKSFVQTEFIMKRLKELNLFHDPLVVNNQHQLRNQIFSTRVYLVLFITSLFISCLYLCLIHITISGETKLLTIEQFRKLSLKYPDTLSCPCTNLGIRHQTFLSFQPRFHEICSKEFELAINPWIDALFKLTQTLTNHHDFRFTAALQFRLITLFCRSVKERISARMTDFNSRTFVSPLLMNDEQFEQQVMKLIDQFIIDTNNAFIYSLQTIQIGTYAAQFASGVRSNYAFLPILPAEFVNGYFHFYFELDIQFYDDNDNGSICNCSSSFLCTSPSKIYNQHEEIVPGFRSGCYILEALLASSLQCFYNITCVNNLSEKIFHTSYHHQLLQQSSKFHPTSTIKVILNELMVENWTKSIDYDLYVDECQARFCSYSFLGHHSFLYISTTMLSLYGGLSLVLRIIVPLIVACIRRKKQINSLSITRRLRKYLSWSKLIKQMRCINLFRSQDSHSVLDIKNEFRSTRIYITLLIIFFGLITEYFVFALITKTKTLQQPSLSQIIQLNNSSPVCRCSKNMISYDKFISVKPSFHPICSSNFIHPTWLNQLYRSTDPETIQFQVPFRLLHLFCQLSQRIFDDKLHQLYNSRMISSQFLFELQLKSEVNVKIEELVLTSRTILTNSLELFRQSSKANNLLSINEFFRPTAFLNFNYRFAYGFAPDSATTNLSLCTESAQFANKTVSFDHFYTSCHGLETLLSSSLISFYNNTTIKQLSYFIFSNQSSFLTALPTPINYLMNDTIESIIRTLMLDNYTSNINHKSYYKQCHPETCLYKVVERYSFMEIISIVLGFIGGVIGFLQWIIPITIKLITRPKNRSTITSTQFADKLRQCFLYLVRSIRSLNLFKNLRKDWYGMISTRIYIVIFTLVLTVLLLYHSLIEVVELKTFESPTYEAFNDLKLQNNPTLTCPCSALSIPHQKFVTLSPKLHQVCSSDFITDRWMHILDSMYTRSTDLNDLSYVGTLIFRTIRILCQSSQRAVDEQVMSFYQTHFVSREALDEEELTKQINQSFQQSVRASERLFGLSLQLIRDITYANQLISNQMTNINIHIFNRADWNTINIMIGISNQTYGENPLCNCLTHASCIRTVALREWILVDAIVHLSGLYMGCFILESVLHSSLECLYRRACIDLIVSYIHQYTRGKWGYISIQLLDSTRNSSYAINSTIDELLRHLMIETWGQKISSEAHFDACQPQNCMYSITGHRSFIVIATILFGILGAINEILSLTIPSIILLIYKVIEKRRALFIVKPIQQ